jgi:hypothetical protein
MNPLVPLSAQLQQLPARVLAKVTVPDNDHDCLIWTGAMTSSGSGSISITGKHVSVHRYLFEQHFGSVPKVLRRTCRSDKCINLNHFQAVGQRSLTERERFHNLVDRSGGPESCHRWLGSKTKHGYPVFRLDQNPDGQETTSARRYGYALTLDEPIDGDVWVTTICRSKDCLNPLHFRETPAPWLKARRPGPSTGPTEHWTQARPQDVPRGSQHPNAKITEEDVNLIFQLRTDGATYKEIGLSVGLSISGVRAVLDGRTWKSVTDLTGDTVAS